MIKYEMPSQFDHEPTKYAGEAPEFAIRERVLTADGREVTIMRYLQAEGLYVVMADNTKDGIERVRRPAFKISPDNLQSIKTENENSIEK